MMWPPIKAWTSTNYIEGHVHFVAINYGVKLKKRWVLLMSVLDSSVVIKVSWEQLVDRSNWKSGWDEPNYSTPCKLSNNEYEIRNIKCTKPSVDSGLTSPITENIIRPWFDNI